MSVRSLQCPGCQQTVNVAAAMTNVRCPACGTVWNVANPSAAQIPPGVRAATAQAKAETPQKSPNAAPSPVALLMILGAVGFMLAMLLVVSAGFFIFGASEEADPNTNVTSTKVVTQEETIKPVIPEPYREVDLPESTRRRIYDQYRKVARTSVEAPLLLPQSGIRNSVEGTLQGVFDRELNRFAALHNVEVEDIQEIIKEGDAKVWDSSPRSHAKRDGKRVYAKELSEGWEGKPGIK